MRKDVNSFNKHKILLIESNQEEAKEISDIISENFHFVCTFNESEALTLLQSPGIEFSTVIIGLDIALSCLTKIRQIPSLENLPVIVSSNCNDAEL